MPPGAPGRAAWRLLGEHWPDQASGASGRSRRARQQHGEKKRSFHLFSGFALDTTRRLDTVGDREGAWALGYWFLAGPVIELRYLCTSHARELARHHPAAVPDPERYS